LAYIFYIRPMTPKIELNGSASVNYLIHGQDLNLSFNFPDAWFVCIRYNPVPATEKFRKGSFWWFQQLHWFKRTGTFQSKVNVFYPQLSVFVFVWGLKKITIPLKVDTVRLKNELPVIQLPKIEREFPRVPKIQIAGYQKIAYPTLKQFVPIKNTSSIPSIHLPWMELEQRLIAKKIK